MPMKEADETRTDRRMSLDYGTMGFHPCNWSVVDSCDTSRPPPSATTSATLASSRLCWMARVASSRVDGSVGGTIGTALATGGRVDRQLGRGTADQGRDRVLELRALHARGGRLRQRGLQQRQRGDDVGRATTPTANRPERAS